MIVRPVSRSHICLSCRRSLTRRKYLPASKVAWQSTNASLQEKESREETELPSVESRPLKYSARRPLIRSKEPPTTNPYPLGRLHGYRGVKLRESLEALEQTTLGEAAKVIVLRDSGYSVYEHSTGELEDKEAEHIDILGQLADERGFVRQEEVNENINSFRPKEGEEPQTRNGINALVLKIEECFSSQQLEQYIEGFEGRRKDETPNAEWVAEEDQAPIIRITPWQPGVSEILDHFDNDPLRGYSMVSHTVKQRLVLRLLRECWGFELPDVHDGIGQFEIELNRDDLAVLATGVTSELNSLRLGYLMREEERLEAFLPRGVVRVTTTHYKKNSIVQAIEEAVKGIKKRKIALAHLCLEADLSRLPDRQLKKWANENFGDDVLQELALLTSTTITRKKLLKIRISAIRNNPHALHSKVDTAIRLLLSSGNFSDRITYQLACHEPGTTTGALVSHPSVEGLPWRERLRQWARWITPVGKETAVKALNSKKLPTILISTEATQKKLKPTTQPVPTKKGDESNHWDTRLFTETSALVGSVIHSSSAPIVTSVTPKTLATSHAHNFSTIVPNISRLLSNAALSWGHNASQQMVLRFQPNPFHLAGHGVKGELSRGAIGAAALSAFPPIEMIFDIDESKNAKLKYVQAIVGESKTDIMLPSHAVDLRFQQRTTSRLKRKYIDQVQEFIKKSKLSLDSYSLDIAPSITLPISAHLCRDPGFKLLDGIPQDPRSEDDQEADFREVEYLYTGLDVRRSLAFQYRKWLLLYTSVEAGKAGGRRGELRLRPTRAGVVMDEKEFVEMAYRLAGDLSSVDRDDVVSKGPVVRRIERFKLPETMGSQEFKYFAKRPLGWTEVGVKLWEARDRIGDEVEEYQKGDEYDAAKVGDVEKMGEGEEREELDAVKEGDVEKKEEREELDAAKEDDVEKKEES